MGDDLGVTAFTVCEPVATWTLCVPDVVAERPTRAVTT